MKYLFRTICWLRTLWRSLLLPMGFTKIEGETVLVSGCDMIEEEKHEDCTVSIVSCEDCGKTEIGWWENK